MPCCVSTRHAPLPPRRSARNESDDESGCCDKGSRHVKEAGNPECLSTHSHRSSLVLSSCFGPFAAIIFPRWNAKASSLKPNGQTEARGREHKEQAKSSHECETERGEHVHDKAAIHALQEPGLEFMETLESCAERSTYGMSQTQSQVKLATLLRSERNRNSIFDALHTVDAPRWMGRLATIETGPCGHRNASSFAAKGDR